MADAPAHPCPILKRTILESASLIIDNLDTTKQLSIPNEFSINVVSIIVGSFAYKADIVNPSSEYQRNHECPAFVQALLQNPGSQIAPSLLEHIRQSNIDTININQYILLIDPMYARPENVVPCGLVSVYPSFVVNPIISTNGIIVNDDMLPAPIKYNSILEPYIVPYDTNENEVDTIIEKILEVDNNNLLINVMDCSSITLRQMWAQNTKPNVYLAMPNCLAKDNTPMYMPVITFDTASISSNLRWINWNLDKDLTSLFQLISPHTYQFLINNYKRLVLETYFIPISKILVRMRISLEYKLDDTTTIIFSKMRFQDFRYLWNNKYSKFASLFISFMDNYYKYNYHNFIEILLDTHSENEEPSMQKILLSYLEEHLTQLKAFFPSEHIPTYFDNEISMQTAIISYLNNNNIY